MSFWYIVSLEMYYGGFHSVSLCKSFNGVLLCSPASIIILIKQENYRQKEEWNVVYMPLLLIISLGNISNGLKPLMKICTIHFLMIIWIACMKSTHLIQTYCNDHVLQHVLRWSIKCLELQWKQDHLTIWPSNL